MALRIRSKSLKMLMRIHAVLVLLILTVLCSSAVAAEDQASDTAQIRQHLMDSIGKIPWNSANGYLMEGQFILKATGDEINYKAKYARSSKSWAADFSQDNQSRNLRYVVSARRAWIATPEITVDSAASSLPYMARFDFPILYEELLRILEKGNHEPRFALGNADNELYIRGKLQNGWEAVYILNTVQFFPRKVFITMIGEPSAAWLLAFAKPDDSVSLSAVPGLSTEFEIWFSDPVDAGSYRYPRRMDFAERGSVVGTFSTEGFSPFPESDALFERTPKFPWLESVHFAPRTVQPQSSLYLDESEIPGFRARIGNDPWAGWNKKSGMIALWAGLMPWIGPLVPSSVSLKLVALAVIISYLLFVLLLLRRRNRSGLKFPWWLLAAGLLAGCLIMIAAIASRQFHRPRDRSLIALHCALRYAATGDSSYARRADRLMRQFGRRSPAHSVEELGYACQALALSYDLIHRELADGPRREIELELFEYAKPLFGASRGWISNTESSCVLAAGLGMVGLSTGQDEFVSAARTVIDRTLTTQLAGGLHRSGPGQGSVAVDSAVNLFYGLKQAKRVDYYSHASFRQYIQAALQMLSPVGTLPLFGDTNLDQPAGLSMLFMKAANQLPEEEGRQCVAAHDLYWAFGQYRAEGWMKRIQPVFQSFMTYFENPYVLLQYSRALPPSAPPARSAVLGSAQYAVLRTGGSPDSIYLALNMPRLNLYTAPRDILAFDVYAYRSLLLHGPGFPGKENSGYREARQTAAFNSITLNNESQSGIQCTGIELSLLNQPIFDFVRASADKSYDYGQVQRDVVMVRPERDHPAYIFLADSVAVNDPGTTVQWYLHGRGQLVTGIDQVSRWSYVPFSPPKWRSDRVKLDAAHPIGSPGTQTSRAGKFYSQLSYLSQDSKTSVIEWTGSKRFCTILFPYTTGLAPKIESLGKDSSRVNATDLISLGTLENPVAVGPLTHVSEYTLVRDRKELFPALMMVSGFEVRYGLHGLSSSKPVTVSMNGLRGGFLNLRPDTQVEIQSPEIRAGDSFLLDGELITATGPGSLMLSLGAAGEHRFRRVD
jgi:hypothetical protein